MAQGSEEVVLLLVEVVAEGRGKGGIEGISVVEGGGVVGGERALAEVWNL